MSGHPFTLRAHGCLRAGRSDRRARRFRRKPIAENLVRHCTSGRPQCPLGYGSNFAILAEIKMARSIALAASSGRICSSCGSRLGLSASTSSACARPSTDGLAPAEPRISGRRELQFERMPDNPVNLTVQLALVRSPQTLDLLGQILPIERLICAAAGGCAQRFGLLLRSSGRNPGRRGFSSRSFSVACSQEPSLVFQYGNLAARLQRDNSRGGDIVHPRLSQRFVEVRLADPIALPGRVLRFAVARQFDRSALDDARKTGRGRRPGARAPSAARPAASWRRAYPIIARCRSAPG